MEKVRLLKFSTHLLKLLSGDRQTFEKSVGFPACEDWPNEDLLDVVDFFLEDRLRNPTLEDWSFLILDLAAGNIVGEIGAKSTPNHVGEVEVGYGVARSQRGRNLASESLALFIAFAFANPKVTAVTAETLKDNLPSIRVLEKTGFSTWGEKDSEDGPLLLWSLKRRPSLS